MNFATSDQNNFLLWQKFFIKGFIRLNLAGMIMNGELLYVQEIMSILFTEEVYYEIWTRQ